MDACNVEQDEEPEMPSVPDTKGARKGQAWRVSADPTSINGFDPPDEDDDLPTSNNSQPTPEREPTPPLSPALMRLVAIIKVGITLPLTRVTRA